GLVASLPIDRVHLWTGMPLASSTASMDGIGIAMGLGFVLSFGYWCTGFRLIQRTLTTREGEETRMVPLIAAAGKLLVPLLVIVPGLAAYRLLAQTGLDIDTHNY